MSENGADTKLLDTLTGVFKSYVLYSFRAACCGSRGHRRRDTDEEEDIRMEVLTIVDSASCVVEVPTSHDGTVAGEHPGLLAELIGWPDQARLATPGPKSQQHPVETTDLGYPEPYLLIQHMGGQFQSSPAYIPSTLSSSDLQLEEPGADDENDEGTDTETQASEFDSRGHLAVGDNADTMATESAEPSQDNMALP